MIDFVSSNASTTIASGSVASAAVTSDENVVCPGGNSWPLPLAP